MDTAAVQSRCGRLGTRGMSGVQAQAIERIAQVPAADWDALTGSDQPFVSHAFLDALESSGSIRRELGWRPQHLLLREDGRLVAALPCYLKSNSHGEFVFDWAWAEAYQRHDLRYYPKLLIGVPYTPVTGPRLLVADGPAAPRWRATLRRTLVDLVAASQLSSAHVNFLGETDAGALAHDPWLPRSDWQFHWHNPGYRDFDDFLDTLTAKKRKNIRQERLHLARAGIRFEHRPGDTLSVPEWQQLHQLYVRTFEARMNTPALSAGFFERLGQRLPDQVLALLAWRGDTLLAMALCLRDRERLYGRYWGSFEEVPGLHFATCYYEGIEYAIRQRLRWFEPGAQGEHKIARGFLPTRVRSAHHIAHPAFRTAIRQAVWEEWRHRTQIARIYAEHSPYRQEAPA